MYCVGFGCASNGFARRLNCGDPCPNINAVYTDNWLGARPLASGQNWRRGFLIKFDLAASK
jgi:hypothetical protein